MTRLQCRGSIARAAFVVALLSCKLANGQIVDGPGTLFEPGGSTHGPGTGIYFDVVNKAKAEQRLDHLEARLHRDAERGNLDAVERDRFLIDRDRYRIAVADWLIRKNSIQPFGYYPVRTDCRSLEAMALVARPPDFPYPKSPLQSLGPMAPTLTIMVTIINAESSGPEVSFMIGGVTRQAAAGSRQDLTVAVDSYISYDAGGSQGQRQYRLAAGRYEFRSTAEGWALYKLLSKP